MQSTHVRRAIRSPIGFSIACAVLTILLIPPNAKWIGTKNLTVNLPQDQAYDLTEVVFYECYGGLDVVRASLRPEIDFRRIDQIEIVDVDTVLLQVQVTGEDYFLFDWFDRRMEPAFLLVIIEDPDSRTSRRLAARNRSSLDTLVANPLSESP